MLRTVGRQFCTKIITATLASTLIIYPILVRANPVVAQNNVQLSPEQIQESLGEHADEIQENFLLSYFYMNKYSQTKEIRDLERAIETAQQAVNLQPNFVPTRIILYLCLSEKAIVKKDITLITQLEPHYQVLMDSSIEQNDLKKIPPPSYYAGAIYYNISYEPMTKEEEFKYEQKAIESLQKAIKISPDYSGSHLLLGRIYYFQDKNDLALSEVQEAIRLNSNDPNNYDLLGDIYADNVHRAEDCWDNEAITKGIRAYKEAIRLASNHVRAHLGLSNMYIHQGAYNLAVMEGKIAVELSDSVLTHKHLGWSLLYTEEYEKAISEYREALKHDKDNSHTSLYSSLGFAHFLQGNFEDAAKEYQQYIELRKTENLSPYSLMYYHLALRQIGKHEEANKLLEDYLPNFKGEEWQLALLQFNLGKLPEIELLNQVSNKCQRCKALFFIGYQYLLKGEPKKAQTYFQKAVDTNVHCSYEYLAARVRLSELKL